MFAQGLHDLVTRGAKHLNDGAQLLVEQRLERQLVTAAADLRCPVLAVAGVHAAVADAVALKQQHVDIERYADVAGKGHFAGASEQAAVAAVVVGQNLPLRAQGVDGIDQIDQVFRVVQVGHFAVFKIQALRQDGAAHAVLPLAQVNQDQRGVGLVSVQLRRERAPHVGQRGKGADDQRDRRSYFFTVACVAPDGAH